MRPIQAALLLLVLAALAATVWLVAGVGGDRPKVAGPTPIESRAPDAPGADAAGEELLAPVAADAPGAAGEQRSALAPEADAAGLPDAAATPGPTLRGRVVDAAGAPVPAARVVAAPARGAGLVALDLLEPGEAAWLPRQEARTAAGGDFELPRIPGEALRLAVRAPGYAPLRTERAPAGPARDWLGELVLERGVVVSGRVVDAAGRAVEGVELHVLADPGAAWVVPAAGAGTRLATTDAGGRFEIDVLAPGPFRLGARHPEHPDQLVEGATSAPGEVLSGLLVRLEPGLEISGRVADLPEGAQAEHEVRARSLGGAEDLLGLGRRAPLAADGAFVLRGLREGREYGLSVVPVGALVGERSESVVARPGDKGVVLRLRPALAVVGTVVDARDESPLERFVVEAGTAWFEALRDDAGEVQEEHPGGRFVFDSFSVVPGSERLSVRVRAEGFASFTARELPIPADRRIDLGTVRLAPVPFVVVRVRDAEDESPVAGARVLLAALAGARDPRDGGLFPADLDAEVQLATSDAAGTARVPSLPGERVVLRVRHKDFAPFESEPLELPAEGGAEHRVRLVRGGAVEVQVVQRSGEPLAGAGVQHLAPEARREPALWPGTAEVERTDAAGRLAFEHLAPGLHRFRLAPPRGAGGEGAVLLRPADPDRGGWVEVHVGERTREELTLEVPPAGTLAGRVTEAGKPLPGAQVSLSAPPAEGRGAAPFTPPFAVALRATADGGGVYALDNVPAGEWQLRVSHGTRAMDATLPVTILEGPNEVDVALDLAVLEGRVTDVEGAPLEGAVVSVRRVSGVDAARAPDLPPALDGGWSFGGAERGVRTDPDGRFQLRGVATGAPIVVQARADGCQQRESAPLELRPGETRGGVDLALPFGGWVEVEVLAADGSPASFVLVVARPLAPPAAGAAGALRREFVQEGGRTVLRGLAPGPWELSARSVAFGARADAAAETEPVRVEVVQKEGQPVRLQLP